MKNRELEVIPVWLAKFRDSIPVEEDFRAVDVANMVYPHCVKHDIEGRLTNKALPTVTRILRRTKGVLEVNKESLVFWAEPSFFTSYDPR